MFNTIIKRDGRTAAYDVEKIARAIFRAATSVGGKDTRLLTALLCRSNSVWRKNILPLICPPSSRFRTWWKRY